MARKSVYTQEMAESIASMIRNGATKKASAHAHGICQDTFFAWVKEKPGFSELITRAEGEMLAEMAARVRAEAQRRDGDWKAALEILKRRERAEWTERTEITGADNTPLSVIVRFEGDDEKDG